MDGRPLNAASEGMVVPRGTFTSAKAGLEEFFRRRGMKVGTKKRTAAELRRIRRGDRGAI